MTIERDPKGDKITCPASGLYSSPAEYSTMGQIVLDLTSLAYQPTTKSRERSGHPKGHVTFAKAERKTAQIMHQTCMRMKVRMTDHLCSQHQGKNLQRKGVTQLLMTETSYPWFLRDHLQLHQCEEKVRQFDKTQPHWNKSCQGTRVSEQRMPRFWAERQKVKLSATLSKTCLSSAT